MTIDLNYKVSTPFIIISIQEQLSLHNNESKLKIHDYSSKVQKTLPDQITTASLQADKPSYRDQEMNNYLDHYSDELLSHFQITQIDTTPQSFLKNHTISVNLRAKMVDWMIEVLTSYKCTQQTFFMAVRLMDHYLMKETRSLTPQDLHLLGVTCMFLACKYEEIYPMKLQVVQDKIAHRKLTKDQIKEKESEICKCLNFKLIGVTLFDIITHVLAKLKLASQVPSKTQQYLYKTCLYLSKMSLYDYEIVQDTSYSLIAAAVCVVSLKIVEQVDSTIVADDQVPKILEILDLKHQDMMDTSNKVLTLAKGFDKKFSNLENLKKFNKFSFENNENSQK